MNPLFLFLVAALLSAQAARARQLPNEAPIDYIPADEPVFELLQGDY